MSERTQPTFAGVYLYVRDMVTAAAFYRRLGFTVELVGEAQFARIDLADGLSIELGTTALTRSYDPGWEEPRTPATNTLNFTLASRDAVDTMYANLTAAGYAAHLAPIDAFWGARYAMVEDPDGNHIGLHSPR